MKKIMFILTLTAFVSCNSGNTSATDSASSAPADTSNAVTPKMPDTAAIKRDTNHVMGDTSNIKNDSMMR